MAPKRRRDAKACEVRYAAGGQSTWQRFSSQSEAVRAFPELAGQLSALINKDYSRCSQITRARFEARAIPAWTFERGLPAPAPAPRHRICVGAVVEAAPQAFGPEHTVRYRGLVIAPGTEHDLPSGCPAPVADESIWRVRYDDDGKVWATPERFLEVVAPPRPVPVATPPPTAPAPPPAPAPATAEPRDPAWYDRKKHVSERLKTVRTVARLLQSRKPGDAEWQRKVPKLAQRLEEELFQSARSFDDYGDARTLKPRLQALAAAMGRRAQQERREADAPHPLAALGAAMVGAVHTAASFEARTGCLAAPARPFAAYGFLERLRARGMSDDFKRILAGAGTDLAAMRRRVTRLLLNDLDILEDFSHLTRHDRPPLSRGGIFWIEPATGTELAAYSNCAAAAREWGLPVSQVRTAPSAANGLRFEYRGSSSPPPRSSCMRDGVYRLLDGRFRVQLGDDWGFLGNYASEGAAALVADRARRRVQPHQRPGPLPRRVGSLPTAAMRRTPGMKTCPDCRAPVYAACNECPGCGYDFEGPRLAARKAGAPGPAAARLAAAAGPLASPPAPPGATTEPAPGRRGLRAAPRAARRDDEDDSTASSAATRAALLAATDELVKSAEAAFFRQPVNTNYVQDYLDVIAKPMDLSTLRADITSRALTSVEQLHRALDLIVTNATTYNPRGHVVHEAALAFARRAAIVVDAARGKILAHPTRRRLDAGVTRVVCARCRKTRALPPGQTVSRYKSTTCADLGITCRVRECSTLKADCSCRSGSYRGVVRTQRGAEKYFCTARAAAQFYRPDDQEKSHGGRIVESCQTGELYLGATWAFAREDCALCASGADPGSILLCDGDGCTVEAHYYCAGLGAVPSGHWFCSKKCRASVPGESGMAPEVEEYSEPQAQADNVTTTDALLGRLFRCSRCDARKPIDAFVNRRTSTVGRDCFACVSQEAATGDEAEAAPAPAPAPAPAAASAAAAPPKAPPPKRKRTAFRASTRVPTAKSAAGGLAGAGWSPSTSERWGVRCDYDALVTRMTRDQWDTTERRRDDGKGSIDRSYTRAGDTKVYRSLLAVARAHYPELLTETGAPAPAPAPAAASGRRPSTDSSDDDESLHAKEPAPASARYAVGDAVEARWKAGLDYYPAIVIGVRAVRGFGVVDLQYSDGSNDKEWGVVEALVRPLKKRRAAVAERVGSAAPAAEGSASGPADTAEARASAPSGTRLACEVREVGDEKWRRFDSRAAADGVFPGLSSQNIGRLINKTPTDPAPHLIRERYEARNAVDGDDGEDDAPTTAPRSNGELACEVRRVGDKEWRRFASRADAARAFTGLKAYYISWLIDKNFLAPQHIRDKYEARNVGDGSSGDDDAAPARKRPRLGLVEVRRTGEKSWRRFATRDDAAAAFAELRDRKDISDLVSRPSKARLVIRGKFEARNVVDEADGEEDSKAEEERPAATAPCGPALIGRKVRIWWPHDREWFTGTVNAFDGRRHEVTYDDGSLWDEDLETPGERKWELVGGDAADAAAAASDALPEEEPCCAICLEPLDSDAPSLEACGHRLHADCLFGAGQLVSHAWADNAPSTRRGQRVECPTCRQASWVPQEAIEGYRVRECKDT